MQVYSLGSEDPLEEGMAIHSNILAWKIPMDRGAWGRGGGWGATIHRVSQSQTQLKPLSMCAHMPSIMNTMLTICELNILEYFLQLYNI